MRKLHGGLCYFEAFFTKGVYMKKVLLVLFAIFVLFGCASTPVEEKTVVETGEDPIGYPRGSLALKKGDRIGLAFDGYYVTSGKQSLTYRDMDLSVPASFHEDNASFMFYSTFVLDGVVQEKMFEVVYSGIVVDESIASPENEGVLIESGTLIGTVTADDVFVCIRDVNLDPYLMAAADAFPKYYNYFWYFAPEILYPHVMKWLSFEPLESTSDPYKLFPVGSTIEKEATYSTENDALLALYHKRVRLEVSLDEYPQPVTHEAFQDIDIETINKVMKDYAHCPLESSFEIDGIPFYAYWGEGFDAYLKDEYVLGEKMYLYLNLSYAYKGKIVCYVRDFSFETGEEIAKRKTEIFLEEINQ